LATAPHDAALSFEALTAPLPDEGACGPDLDADGDAAYMNFMAAGEGLLPATFYERDARDPERDGQPFDRTKIDFPAQYAKIATFAALSHDLRLVVLLAKFRVLDKDLSGFVAAVEALAVFLERYWEAVHPRGENGDFLLRMVAVQSLDDMAPVILPLNYAPLFEHKRFGSVTYRMHLLAVGEAAARAGEDKPDPTLVKRAFEEDVDLGVLIERRNALRSLGLALARVKAAFVEHVGLLEAVDFPRLAPLVESIRALLDGYVALRDPSAGDAGPAAVGAEGEAPVSTDSGKVENFTDAAAALRAVAAYYARFEPSNPALLLVRQAEQLIGKSFLDAIRVLVPGHVEAAALQIGRAHVFDLPIERLSEFASVEDVAVPDENVAPSFEVTTRDNALQLLAKVSAFYHRAEPSSPVSFLTERARTLTGRDFLGLLKDMLPPDTLKSLEGGK
jgi:type VI secretion system protein ImpA